MRVSVIVCTNNRRRQPVLLQALASLARQTSQPSEIIVVVDHNDEFRHELAALANQGEGVQTRLLPNAHPRGLSGARNTGVEAASGDVLAFIDDDAIASDNWLERLLEGYADERVWGVGGRVVPRWLAQRPAWFPEEFLWVIGCTYAGMPSATTHVRNLHGCNASFRRELFEEVGGFSPALGRRGTFLAGAEETELCLRATASRPEKTFLYRPDAVVFHVVSRSRTRWSYFLSRCFTEGRSKAWMVRSTGMSRGLSAEANYLKRVPRLAGGLARESLMSADPDPLFRGAAVLAGTAATVAGFAVEAPTLCGPAADNAEPLDLDRTSGEESEPLPVSAVICTYSDERWPLLCRAIGSLERQTHPAIEIVVAVDHNPQLGQTLRESFPEIHVVENSGPRGLSGARNVAIAASRGGIIAFLDDDAVAEPSWLAHIAGPFVDRWVAGVGGLTSPEWATARPFWWPDEFDWVVGASYRGMPSTRRLVRNVHGGNAAFRRSLFDRVGGFLPEVGRVLTRPYGGEETEWCIRAKRLVPTVRFVHEPAARIRHHVPPERTSIRYFILRCYLEGVSKARIVRKEGLRAGLGIESAYVGTVLQRSAWGAVSSLGGLDRAGLAHAGVSVLGIGAASLGFLVELARALEYERRSRESSYARHGSPQAQ